MSNFDDTTQFMPLRSNAERGRVSNSLFLQVSKGGVLSQSDLTFSHGFTIGRGSNNDCVVADKAISREHLELKLELGEWFIFDKGSTNGTLVNGLPLEPHRWVPLSFPSLISFGSGSTTLNINTMQFSSNEAVPLGTDDLTEFISAPKVQTNSVSRSSDPESTEEMERRFLSSNDEEIGDYTKMVRGVIAKDRMRHKKKNRFFLISLVFLLVGAISLVAYQQNSISRARAIAIEMFYDVKKLEIDLSSTELLLKQEHSTTLQQAIIQKRERLEGMQSKYQAYLDELKSMDFRQIISVSREEELILKVARAFGECELELSDGFTEEVKKYISYWKKTPRMINAMAFMNKNNYLPIMVDAMEKEGLPRHFLYLSLQESNFNPRAIGPETRFGIAKGAWQFLPTTGEEFGLRPGGLAGSRVFDDEDERFNFEKATYAAARYLKHIYTTEAQASGLLVMAGYNFGHNRVKSMIRKMPQNPKDRNFWRFFKTYEDRIPQETKDYVFYIFSAAVIGEDPKFFGFDFKSPSDVL